MIPDLIILYFFGEGVLSIKISIFLPSNRYGKFNKTIFALYNIAANCVHRDRLKLLHLTDIPCMFFVSKHTTPNTRD